jgi:hypothetical protein
LISIQWIAPLQMVVISAMSLWAPIGAPIFAH